jgi:hypothetical protein
MRPFPFWKFPGISWPSLFYGNALPWAFSVQPGQPLEERASGNKLAIFAYGKAALPKHGFVIAIVANDRDHGWLNLLDEGGGIFLGLDRPIPGPKA